VINLGTPDCETGNSSKWMITDHFSARIQFHEISEEALINSLADTKLLLHSREMYLRYVLSSSAENKVVGLLTYRIETNESSSEIL
jgi:hypothetical protein